MTEVKSDTPVPVPVAVLPDPGEAPGKPPYEVEWSGRREYPPATVSFEDVAGWQARAWGEGTVSVGASRAQRIWREQTLRVDLGPGEQLLTVEVRPPAPIELPADADSVRCWVTVPTAQWPWSPKPVLALTLADSRGQKVEVEFSHLENSYWMLLNARLTDEQRAVLHPPLALQCLTLTCPPASRPNTLYIESMAFFREQRRPYLRAELPPDMRYPIDDDNMLPPPPAGCVTQVRESDGAYVFSSDGPDGTVRYLVGPREGSFADVALDAGTAVGAHPLRGGGLRFVTADGPVLAGASNATLLGAELVGGQLLTRWRFASAGTEAEYRMAYRLSGRTLVMDLECPGGACDQVVYGKVTGMGATEAVEVPYLRLGVATHVAMTPEVFVSILPDWLHSNATYTDDTSLAAADGVCLLAATVYMPLTDGRRNDLRERIYLTASPRFEDVLPRVANPRSPNIERLAADLLVVYTHGARLIGSWAPDYFATLKRYGLDHVIVNDFSAPWITRVGEGYGCRWRPHPGLTVKQVQDYREHVRGLGYKWGMQIIHCDLFPFNEYFDEDRVALRSDGTLMPFELGVYRTKPNAMAELARKVGARINELYPTDCVYLDVHTNLMGPVDFEAGVPMAGMQRGMRLFNAASILEVRRQHGTVFSEGHYRWAYAGLTDMDYAQWMSTGASVPVHNKPILPDFDLLRLHPLHIGVAMGFNPRQRFFTEAEYRALATDSGVGTELPEFYHWVAATLAHGHSGMLGYNYHPPLSRTIQYYAMMSGPQREYLPDTVDDIAWYSGAENRFVTTAEALRSGIRADGRIRIRYRRGLAVHVNYHPEQTWDVRAADRAFVLPPYGWVLHRPGELLSYSAVAAGRRVDYVTCPEYVYLNSGGRPVSEGGVTVDGAVFVGRSAECLVVVPCGDLGPWRVEPMLDHPQFVDRRLENAPADRGVRALRLDLVTLWGAPARSWSVVGRQADGDIVSRVTVGGEPLELAPTAGIVDWAITPE